MEAKTERELIIQMNGKIDSFAESMERIVNTLERLETVKFEGHEQRINRLEKFMYQWGGALVAFNILMALAGLVIAWKK